ncbi:hypothetical protein VTO42DRAFT_3030 [Malbranchea cinnamomea]
MTLAVLPATIPDIHDVYAVYFAAFASQLVTDVLFPDALVPGPDGACPSAQFLAAHAAATLQWWHHPASRMQHVLKCVDTVSGDIVGMAVWEVWWRGRREERGERTKPVVPWLAGHRRDRAERFLEGFWRARERWIAGRRHVYLQTIAVHPAHQRRGIGRLLMQWGLDVAERLNVPVYLEATYEGLPLYEKCGFLRLKEGVVLGPEITKMEHDIVAPLMVRMPGGLGRMTFEEWANGDEED